MHSEAWETLGTLFVELVLVTFFAFVGVRFVRIGVKENSGCSGGCGLMLLLPALAFVGQCLMLLTPVRREEVPGMYQTEMYGVSEILTIAKDGTFQQKVILKDGREFWGAGHWQFKRSLEVSVLKMSGEYLVASGYQPDNPPESVKSDGVISLVVERDGTLFSQYGGVKVYRRAPAPESSARLSESL